MIKKVEHATTNMSRPPIVVIMGHIDHGKTSILDWYRHTKVTSQETGGITQHIGAYEVTHEKKTITFIDTPGHEAFSKMRSRGARVADIAILVVAADEGVRPQTREAIGIIRTLEMPFIVALNKIDKPEANVERVKQELAKEEILIESYGGKIPAVELSAKKGTGMEELLEMILLIAELSHVEGDASLPAEGVVIESHLDPRRGTSATLLVRNGTYRKQDILVMGQQIETARIVEDFLGHAIEEAKPSSPIRITGLSSMPAIGDTFHAFATKKAADEFKAQLPPIMASADIPRTAANGKIVFNIILKSDVSGSKEVLEESLTKIESAEIRIRIIKSEVGDINESDVKMALATERVTLIGFKVKIDASAKELAEHANIHIVTGEVIYNILDAVKRVMEEMIPPEIRRTPLGKARILKLFKNEGSRQIVGGRVEDGVIEKNAKIEIIRFGVKEGTAIITSLQRNKIDTESVAKGSEFGMQVISKTPINENDILEVYREEIIKRTL